MYTPTDAQYEDLYAVAPPKGRSYNSGVVTGGCLVAACWALTTLATAQSSEVQAWTQAPAVVTRSVHRPIPVGMAPRAHAVGLGVAGPTPQFSAAPIDAPTGYATEPSAETKPSAPEGIAAQVWWGVTVAVSAAVSFLYLRHHAPTAEGEFAMASVAGDAPQAEPVVEVLPEPGADDIVGTKEEAQAGWWLNFGIGRCAFWCQLWLSAISATVLLFSAQYAYSGMGALLGVGFTVVSNITSWLSVLWTLRCRKIGKLLQREEAAKAGKPLPTKSEVARLLWSGVILNVNGLAASVIGIEANTGLLLAQSLSAGQTVLVPGYNRGVAAFDVFAQLASAQTLMSLIIGISVALQALRIVTKPYQKPATA